MRKSLIIFRGLPGTGKTFLINKISELIPDLIIVSRDIIRSKVIVNPSYSGEEKNQIVSIMLFMIEEHMKSKAPIVIDGMTFPTKESYKPFMHAALKHNIQFRIIECFCSEETSLRRIESDIIEKGNMPAEADDDLYYHVKEIFEPITDFHLKINTDEDSVKNIEKIINYLSAKIMVLKNAD